ncbi:DNA-binding response regulator, NarL/FixJ family, contains REC and HTH domains [Aliiroseovarius halocynthiae]|uniref:Response regulator transcription factor n=1 Tax=Aliiroseovarius halocynthiae TaxID=985055 RepID=A0A545SNA0_9RHOB|nr:response regulator transcription factor [Aliiroseovarius halocynthiae]TQV66458.1 response regulator transcription factor [Aliiroseovarius halocynthiae]SMR83609.1 DNA-binding response regulator, NarL/FixJ family, contains REC and HTH domains [Aliiroseovarius halocynthiae]
MTSHILIVEDDELHRRFLRDMLPESDLGEVDVTEAQSGEEAINLIKSRHFDNVVLDLQMPGKSGVDVARAVWAKNSTTPILFWSNHADEAYARGIYRVAPKEANYGYLLKSTSSQRLKSTISGVFRDGQTIVDRAVNFTQHYPANSAELTIAEYETLVDIAIGLTDHAVAEYRSMSVRSVQGRIKGIYEKLTLSDVSTLDGGAAAVNRRTRAIALALIGRKINSKILEMAEKDLRARGKGHYLD